jgi:hypothetical protein
MNQTINICDVVLRKVVDNKTSTATYKIKGGGIVNVKSIFGSHQQFYVFWKDAIFPAILTTLKLNEKV